ncbi:hypothetical protein [Flavobacterium sp.]|uniref:hypothetical protein n=1 Tax=Flavobacterium sp. TaxID=239 RepID=UPI0033414217
MRFFIVILFLGLFSCKKENDFFESIDKVRLISYTTRTGWNPNEKFDYNSKKEIIIPDDKIIDDVILKKEDFNSILKILKNNEDTCDIAACYDPRHKFQFYKNGKVIAYYEVCLECGGHQNSKNLDFLPPFCVQKGEELKQVFIKMKLKNSGEGSSILDKLEN